MARVLVVDDEKHIVRLVQINLQRAGFEVLGACDGREALAVIASERPDAVTLDIMMPYMDGWEVLRRVREDPSIAGTRVVLLTAWAGAGERARECGADEYLTKPFNPITLIDVLRGLLDGAAKVAT